MSEVIYCDFTARAEDIEQWQVVFAALEKSGFGAKFHIALESLSQEAGDRFEQLMEDNGNEIGVFEEWSQEGVTFSFDCDVPTDIAEDIAALFALCGAQHFRIEIPE